MDIEISNIEVLGNMVLIERSENDTSLGELSLSASSSTPRSSGTILQLGKSCPTFIESRRAFSTWKENTCKKTRI